MNAVTKPKIDLKELAARESEQIEWKENVASIEDVLATVAAFANDFQNLGDALLIVPAGREGLRALRMLDGLWLNLMSLEHWPRRSIWAQN